MLCVCVVDVMGVVFSVCIVMGVVFSVCIVMGVVFSVCIVRRGAVGARVWECECFVMHMVYVCVLCASCGSSQ